MGGAVMLDDDDWDIVLWRLHAGIDAHAARVLRELKSMTERNRRAIGQYTRIRRRR